MRIAAVALILASVLAPARAQEPRPLAFEVTSVKVNTSGDWRRSIGPSPGGRFIATNQTLRDLIPFAYGLPQTSAGFRVLGGPKWIDEDRFDITAKVDGSWTPQQMSDMLRTLLADRFTLKAHRETRDMPTYTLVMVRGPQAFGPHLRRSEIDDGACAAVRAAVQRREPVPARAPGAKPVCGTGRTVPGTITSIGFPIDLLVASLGPFTSRFVADKTGLTGLFDYELTWTPEQIPQVPPDAPPLTIDPNGPSLFTALQEQLGLKLESTRGPVDVVVIDRVEHPTED